MFKNMIRSTRRRGMTLLCGVTLAVMACALPGCSLGVMFSKMLTGDPVVTCEFKAMTREDLVKGKKTVLVVCSTPESVEQDLATLKFDMIDGVTRRLKLRGVKVVNPDSVASWIDKHGGIGADPSELAQDFETDYIIHIDVQTFGFREPNSPKLLRGNASGFVRAFKVDSAGTEKIAQNVYTTEFASTYPTHQPLSEQGRTSVTFQKDYVDRVCDMLARKFYDHDTSEDF